MVEVIPVIATNSDSTPQNGSHPQNVLIIKEKSQVILFKRTVCDFWPPGVTRLK